MGTHMLSELRKYHTWKKCEDKMKCITRIQGKMRRKAFRKSTTEQTNETLELIHIDIVGKISPSSLRHNAWLHF